MVGSMASMTEAAISGPSRSAPHRFNSLPGQWKATWARRLYTAVNGLLDRLVVTDAHFDATGRNFVSQQRVDEATSVAALSRVQLRA
jgi:hypothetical protein